MAKDYIGELQNQNNKQGVQSKTTWLNTALPLVGAGLGATAGGVAGAAGGALIPGANLSGIPEIAGGYGGGVAGAGLGAAAGNGLADMINDTFLGKNVDPNQSLKDTIGAGETGAISQAVGVPVTKGIAYLAHPIAPFIQAVDNKLASSAKTVDFSKLLQDYEENTLPEFKRQGFGQKATDAFNMLRNDITAAVNAYKPHTPADSGMGQVDVSNMELPIAQANDLKRNIMSNLSKYYGGDTGNIDIEARKAFGGDLRNNIASQEPGVKLPNTIASALYKVPENAQGLLNILAVGQPQAARAINTISNLPANVVQTVIPQGGGYLNQVIPRLVQLLGGS